MGLRNLQDPVKAAANGVVPFTPFEAELVKAGSGARPIVILPGFGNNSADYTEPFGDKASSLSQHLEVSAVCEHACFAPLLSCRVPLPK